MSKYIDADRLKAEIEELEGLEYPCDNSEQNVGFEYALDRVSDIINSLQQEQPCDTCTNDKGCVTCKDGELWEGKEVDLEKEIDLCWQDWLSPSNQSSVEGVLPKSEFSMYARHFYILGLKNNIPVTQITLDELSKEGGIV